MSIKKELTCLRFFTVRHLAAQLTCVFDCMLVDILSMQVYVAFITFMHRQMPIASLSQACILSVVYRPIVAIGLPVYLVSVNIWIVRLSIFM